MGRRKGLTFYQRKKKLNMVLIKEIASWIFWMFVSAFLAIVLVFCMGMKTNVIGSSMEPCLYNGQEIFLNRVIYRLSSPKIGDVVVFRPNGNESSHYYIKRIIALPGETIECVDGKILIDGEEIKENYKTTKIKDLGVLEEPITLGTNEFFVMGDDRENSEDSRNVNIGNVKRSEIVGKVWFVVSPMKDFGFVK